ncbi:MAG: SagB/ThcOx family dehydrogenase [Eubacterium sp.]|nr:SagB/ThcOx family dehydrogenase [Eubacterium sp.]
MIDVKYFWNKNHKYKVEENEVTIGNTEFPAAYAAIFPAFFDFTQNGATEDELIERFNEISKLKMKRFIAKLEQTGVLLTHIQEPDEIFKGQFKLLGKSYPEDYFLKNENVSNYRKNVLEGEKDIGENAYDIPALSDGIWTKRKSCRNFTNEKVSKEAFLALMGVLIRYDGEEFLHGTYPSAGGLYPVRAYILVKEDRVEGVAGGLYYLNAAKKKLQKLNAGNEMGKDMHFFLNKEIFDTSAFSIYLVFDAEVSMTKYRDRGYFYGILDTGIVMGYLNLKATELGIGCCCIGELKDKAINECLNLGKNEVYMQCIEFGGV